MILRKLDKHDGGLKMAKGKCSNSLIVSDAYSNKVDDGIDHEPL